MINLIIRLVKTQSWAVEMSGSFGVGLSQGEEKRKSAVFILSVMG